MSQRPQEATMLFADTYAITSYTNLQSAHTLALSTFSTLLSEASERVLAQGGLSTETQAHITALNNAVFDAIADAADAQIEAMA
jgi:hypothetical protein